MGKDLFDLTGKKAVVTGGGRGLGKAVALGLAERGADVGLVARTASELDAAAREIEAIGRRAAFAVADLTKVPEIAPALEDLAARLGGLDIFVNNAGVNVPQNAEDVTEEAWDKVMDVNLKGAFFAAQAAGRIMIRLGRGGRIITMSSQVGSVAHIQRAAYCASKAGANLVTRSLALEWARHGILVNAVAPTFIETALSRPFLAEPSFHEYALSKNLLKRFGTLDDAVGAVIYLAAPASSIVTGHILMVDAGWTCH